MTIPSSDDSFLDFSLPANYPTWGMYLQYLPQKPTKLWMPFEDDADNVAAEGYVAPCHIEYSALEILSFIDRLRRGVAKQ